MAADAGITSRLFSVATDPARLHSSLGQIAPGMIIERKIVVPVVCCIVLLSIVTTWFPFLVLPEQFRLWEYHLGLEHFGGATRLFRHLYRGGPVLSVLLLGTGAALLRRRECDGLLLAWYAGAALVVLAIWTFWTLGVLHGFYELSQPA